MFHLPLSKDDGAVTGLGKSLKLLTRPERDTIPIYIAALGPKSVEQAAEIADGWIPHLFHPEKAHLVWGDALAAGAAKRSADLKPLEINANAMVAIGEGPETKALLDFARPIFALYVGGMGARGKNFYNDVAVAYGYEKEAAEIQDLYLSGKKKEAEALVPTEWLEAANLVGPASYVKERHRRVQGGRRHQPRPHARHRRPGRHHRAGEGMGVLNRCASRTPVATTTFAASRLSIPSADFDEIASMTAREEFPWDYVQGTSIAFMRDYGVPSISRLLHRTGEFERHGPKRYDDTILIGEESTIDGIDSERGHAAVRRLNRIHGHYDIPNDEFAYVLATTIVGPVRWISAYGWRPLDPHELVAMTQADHAVRRADGDPGAAVDVRRLPAAAARLRTRTLLPRPGQHRARRGVDRHRASDCAAPRSAAGPTRHDRADGRAAARGAGAARPARVARLVRTPRAATARAGAALRGTAGRRPTSTAPSPIPTDTASPTWDRCRCSRR